MTKPLWTGTVDLSNCDREPIHVPGSIQAHGILLAFDPVTGALSHASANAAGFLAISGTDLAKATMKSVLGATLTGELTSAIAAARGSAVILVRQLGKKLKGHAGKFNVSAHEYSGRCIVEIEPADAIPGRAPLELVRAILTKLQQTRTLQELCGQTVEQLRGLMGFDRVMIYRFLHDGTGQVIAEAKQPEQETLLSLRYPASDIPKQARELYKRNWVRLIADVGSPTVPLTAVSPQDSGPLDLSHAELRSVSPIHIEYLTNMGVGASMSISIVVGGELWGLIACHHKEPRKVPANERAAAELIGQVFSLQIQTVEGIEAYVTMRAARALLDRIVAEFPIEGSLIENMSARLEQISSFVASDGSGILVDGVWRGSGLTPSAEEIRLLARHIDGNREDTLFATHHLAEQFPPAEHWPCAIRGVLALPLSYEGSNWLFFFRKEVVHTIEWGGDPNKPVVANAAGRISPRKSFEIWKQNVTGQSLPWTSRERLIADTLRIYLLDIIVRFSDVIMEERRRAEQRQRLLTTELNHRVKGTLELIQSLIHHGYGNERRTKDFVRILEGRIRAISLAHDAIAMSSGSEIRTLVETAVSMQAARLGQVDINGPDARLEPKAYTVLALVLHEMATSAAQTGALASADGRLSVNWFIDPAGKLVVLWEEKGRGGGRDTVSDELSGVIMRRNIPHALGGEAEIAVRADGLKATFVIPHRYLVHPPARAIGRESWPQIAAPQKLLDGYSVLVVEDQMAAAIDLQQDLEERGAAEVHIAGNASSAIALIERSRPDIAVLDIDLGDTTCVEVAAVLEEAAIPYVYAGTAAELALMPPALRDHLLLDKPYVGDVVAGALKEALLPHLIRAVLTKLI